ncbi:hypothetical protein Poli38472_010753 [Pythium oligandrum]|uniref:Uncharacterized protein n=1 Tax=Pythium oligandrum TaxID=41045 RepID=A0A8K1CEF6_PYTOL|nr:hypothetical protein Poli38472_010753 [Pythium oligandrum]|eukprot:TMW61690.1 hypothetical protein Poli38472_010753 [Pythium oligandrum]
MAQRPERAAEPVDNDEEEERIDAAATSDSDDDDDDDAVERDLILSKDDVLLLRAFHRMIPLPALSSRIVRVLCDSELEVPEEDTSALSTLPETPHEPSVRTRRGPAFHVMSARLKKPHRHVDLSATSRQAVNSTRGDDERCS